MAIREKTLEELLDRIGVKYRPRVRKAIVDKDVAIPPGMPHLRVVGELQNENRRNLQEHHRVRRRCKRAYPLLPVGE